MSRRPRSYGRASASTCCPPSPDPATRPKRRGASVGLPGDLHERTIAYAALDALWNAVAKSDAACARDVAAAAWHAEPIVRFVCSAFGDCLAGVRASDDNLIARRVEVTLQRVVHRLG